MANKISKWIGKKINNVWKVLDATDKRTNANCIIYRCKNLKNGEIYLKSSAYLKQFEKRGSKKISRGKTKKWIKIPISEFSSNKIANIVKNYANDVNLDKKDTKNKPLDRRITYVSLFSSAGVGCYAFKKLGFECVATSEILERRLNIQKINNKCKFNTGYICGDITKNETKEKILNEIKKWNNEKFISKIDVLMATPPCQGMSTANYKKGDETCRNSLVIEAINMIKTIEPRIFILENVKSFLTTYCADNSNKIMTIGECIDKNLNDKYNIFSKIINFKDYGVPSSRPRTIVIGTLKTEKNFTPLNLFPLKSKIVTLKQAIGDLKPLKFGEKTEDLLHSFRTYPIYMESWIKNLKEGQSAFETKNKPYKIVNGKKHLLKGGYMGNKFCRMYWEKPAPCITTRNDQLASQTTIHPRDNRVLSIRELMRVMSIPDDFKWVNNNSQKEIDKNETLIRQTIGEAVPTSIISQIADNIKDMLEYDAYVKNYESGNSVKENNKNFYIQSFKYESQLVSKKESGSFYTPQIVVYHTIKKYISKSNILKILEPSCGAGAFIPQFLRLIDDCDRATFDLVDINSQTIDFVKKNIKLLKLNKKIKFNFINNDFLLWNSHKTYDVVLSNPPYKKINKTLSKKYCNQPLTNLYLLFLNKFISLSNNILCVIPKSFLMTPESNYVRHLYEKKYTPTNVFDYGTKYFNDVFVEIISINFSSNEYDETLIENPQYKIKKNVSFSYICQEKCWLLYRNEWFDNYLKKLNLDIFSFYRDRQLTNKYLTTSKDKIWVIRSRNLSSNGKFKHIKGYDKYINSIDKFNIKKFLNLNSIVFPNFTYNTRASYLPKNCIVNGSFCILIPKNKNITIDTKLYSTQDFRKYYAIIKNLSKFTINLDTNSIFYIGIMK